MRQTKTFVLFGVEYTTTEWSADEGARLLSMGEATTPIERLSGTRIGDVALDNRAAINAHVRDNAAGVIDPEQVLSALLAVVNDFNLGFLKTYSPVPTPGRFRSQADSNVLPNEDPHIERVVSSRFATLLELQRDYSTRDMFRLIDIAANSNLNQALESEAAHAAAKAKANRK